jgi:urease subunit gamma/beta
LALALYGSFLPLPPPAQDAAPEPEPGEVQVEAGDIEMNAGRRTATMAVTNLGDRPVQVGSHYPFIETNASLRFDRGASLGMRLDIPAGTAVRFEPGETKTVTLVEIAGERIVRGGSGLVDGLASLERLTEILQRVSNGGFASRS